MKKRFKKLPFLLLTAAVVFMSSCERESLEEVISKEQYPGVGISLNQKIEIGGGANFTLSGGELTIPITLQFSAPTTRAFTVSLTASSESVPQLISSNVLPAGTLPITTGSFNVPSAVEVPIGVTSASFNLIVSRSFIEINYGKNIAVSVNVSNPSKENNVINGKDAIAVLIKTGEVMSAEAVHDIEFATTTKQFLIPSPGAYEIGSESITVRVPITVKGDLGSSFSVEAVLSPDTVTKYIQNGELTNVVGYHSRKISVQNQTVQFDANTRTAYLVFTTKRDTLLAIQPAAGAATINKPVIAFTLRNPSKYQLGKKMKTVFVVMDPNFFRPYNGTPFVVKGGINAVSEPIYAAYYDFGGINIAWWDNGGKSGDANWRLPDMVDVAPEYTPRTAIGWTAANEYVTYSIVVEETGFYEMDMYFGSSNGNGRYSVFIDNADINGGVKANLNTGAHGNQLSHKSTVRLEKGFHIFKVFFNAGDPDYRGTIFTRKS